MAHLHVRLRAGGNQSIKTINAANAEGATMQWMNTVKTSAAVCQIAMPLKQFPIKCDALNMQAHAEEATEFNPYPAEESSPVDSGPLKKWPGSGGLTGIAHVN
ncbi:hypothetical protein T01_15596 [Trichinella spiralis]|uniref:Uncharacterized protein n=1 Tax=Trichinella spiralis TaxID=6334 RepID=A0A0V1BY10_TRISP|nr:hypothetical protein T01_15596 [Trichinella spiralis]